MAGTWIKMRIDLRDDPDVIAMAARTGLDEYAVVGRLHSAWSWADAHTTDGHAPGVTPAWLDRYVLAEGFAAAMASVGWLEQSDHGITFPNFERHNTQTGKQRALAANRQANRRAIRHEGSSEKRHASSVTQGAPRVEERREDTTSSNPLQGSDGEWVEVELLLKERGVAAARAAVTSARNRGAAVAEVLEIVEEFDAATGRFGPGALQRRVAGDLAAWPPADPAATRAADDRAAAAKRDAERKESDRRKAENRLAAAEAADLERQFGARLDAMQMNEQRALAELAYPSGPAAAMTRLRRGDRTVRAELLRVCRDRSPPRPARAG